MKIRNTKYTAAADGKDVTLVVKDNLTLRAEWDGNALTGNNINIVWKDYADISLFSYEVSGDNITFTADGDYESYAWWLSNSTEVQSEEKSFVWNTSSVSAGTYYVTLTVQTTAGVYRAASMIVAVNK